MPIRRRTGSATTIRSIPYAAVRPAIAITATTPSSTTPNSCPAVVRAASVALSWVIAWCASAHPVAIAPPIAPSASSSVARRRSGTSTNQQARPITAAISAPRE